MYNVVAAWDGLSHCIESLLGQEHRHFKVNLLGGSQVLTSLVTRIVGIGRTCCSSSRRCRRSIVCSGDIRMHEGGWVNE